MEKIKYLQKYFSGPKQGSEDWLAMRAHRFGGSEIKDIKKVDKLLQTRKIDKTSDLYCWWGKWFEQVARKELNFELYDFSAIPCAKIPVAYSPDGIYIDKNEEDLHLVEIKCPFLKEKLNFEDYLKQVQTGLYILPVKDCLLVLCKFRKCSFLELTKEYVYDAEFHKPWLKDSFYHIKKTYTTKELFSGVLIWSEENDKAEKYHYRLPDVILTTNDKIDPIKYICNMEKGHFICFKCFEFQKITIYPDNSIKEIENYIWGKYKEMENLHNNETR